MTEPASGKLPLFELLDDLRIYKENLLKINSSFYEKEYSPYVINRFLSMRIENLFYVQDINQRAKLLTKQQQYDYLIATIPKNKQWLSYPKRDKSEKIVEYLMRLFSYSRAKAEIAFKVLSEEQKLQLLEKCEKHLKK